MYLFLGGNLLLNINRINGTMVSKIILFGPLTLLISAIVVIVLYFFHDNTVTFNSSWVIASFSGSIISGAAIGITAYSAFKTKKSNFNSAITSPMLVPIA